MPDIVMLQFWVITLFAKSTIDWAIASGSFDVRMSFVSTWNIIWTGFFSRMHGLT